MGARMYIGDSSNMARNTHNILIGDNNNIARNVHKAYIGGNDGTARCVYSPDIEMYGEIEPLTKPVAHAAATTVGKYALFVGGFDGDEYGSDYTDNTGHATAYSTYLTRIQVPYLRMLTFDLAAATLGNLAFFGGGRVPYSYLADTHSRSRKDVIVCDSSLTRIAKLELSQERHGLATSVTDNYVLFAGGQSDYFTGSIDPDGTYDYHGRYHDTVDAFGTDLVRLIAPALNLPRSYVAGASVGGYAVFAGGMSKANFDSYGTITDKLFLAPTVTNADAYDDNLTKMTIRDLKDSACRMIGIPGADECTFYSGIHSYSSDTSPTGMRWTNAYSQYAYNTSLLCLTYSYPNPGSIGHYYEFQNLGAGIVMIEKDNVQYNIAAGGRLIDMEVYPYTSFEDFYNESILRVEAVKQNGIITSNLFYKCLSKGRSFLAATTVGDFAIFAGGARGPGSAVNNEPRYEGSTEYCDTVEVFKI